jgi:hypothetical protein
VQLAGGPADGGSQRYGGKYTKAYAAILKKRVPGKPLGAHPSSGVAFPMFTAPRAHARAAGGGKPEAAFFDALVADVTKNNRVRNEARAACGFPADGDGRAHAGESRKLEDWSEFFYRYEDIAPHIDKQVL